MRKALTKALALAFTIPAITFALPVTPASAGDCDIKFCGGVVINKASRSIVVSNCWDDDNIYVQEGHYLKCHENTDGSIRIGNDRRAAIGLLAGHATYQSRYSRYYDTDAVRFPSGCVTEARFAWEGPYITDRRGRPPLWGRIESWQEFTVIRITC